MAHSLAIRNCHFAVALWIPRVNIVAFVLSKIQVQQVWLFLGSALSVMPMGTHEHRALCHGPWHIVGGLSANVRDSTCEYRYMCV